MKPLADQFGKISYYCFTSATHIATNLRGKPLPHLLVQAHLLLTTVLDDLDRRRSAEPDGSCS